MFPSLRENAAVLLRNLSEKSLACPFRVEDIQLCGAPSDRLQSIHRSIWDHGFEVSNHSNREECLSREQRQLKGPQRPLNTSHLSNSFEFSRLNEMK